MAKMCYDCGEVVDDPFCAGSGWWNDCDPEAVYCESCYERLMDDLEE